MTTTQEEWLTKAKERVGGSGRDPTGPVIQSSAEFVKGFVPPDYVLDGVLQRRFLYSLTGRTGSGKTAVVLLIAASVALGRSIGSLEVTEGRVLYFAGENPDDVRMRWIAMAQNADFDVDAIDVCFIPGRFKISKLRNRILNELRDNGGVVLVIIDTSAAYFEGDESNNNVQQAAHAAMLRALVNLPGGPCVLANCHPVKNAAPDNLVPYGGGAFLNEVDGNLTCSINDSAIEVHWQGKFRGPDFAPLTFTVRSVTHELLKDSKGRLIPTAQPLRPVIPCEFHSPAATASSATTGRGPTACHRAHRAWPGDLRAAAARMAGSHRVTVVCAAEANSPCPTPRPGQVHLPRVRRCGRGCVAGATQAPPRWRGFLSSASRLR